SYRLCVTGFYSVCVCSVYRLCLFRPLRHMFIPVFLNCWLAKIAMQEIFNDLHRVMQRSQSALAQQLLVLGATLMCIVFV
ncbi:unnamed protein product, partial [Candidula unifasciata]